MDSLETTILSKELLRELSDSIRGQVYPKGDPKYVRSCSVHLLNANGRFQLR